MGELQLTHESRSLLWYLDPVRQVRSLWGHRSLTCQFAGRTIRSKYKGQALGIAWSLIDPLVTLAIYTFVFGVIFHRASRDGPDASGGIARYALEVFAGILVFGVFRETVGAAPMLIVGQRNFVKKVVYPLETFPVSQLLVSVFNLGTGLVVWLAGDIVFSQSHIPSPRMLLLPVVVLPVALLSLGIAWFLASLGVFIRDLRNPVNNILHMLFFLSAIFYRAEQVPERYRVLININPLAQSIAAAREVMFGEGWPDWTVWSITTVAGLVLCVLGHAFFMKSRSAFADVI